MSAAETYKALCQRCHGEKGDGHGPVAIYLDPYPRDLTKAGFMNSKPLDALRRLDSEGRARHLDAGVGQGARRTSRSTACWTTCFTTFTKEPRRELKPRKVPDENPVAIERRVRRPRRADLRAALRRLPRPEGRRQGAELARHHAASAQPAQFAVCGQRHRQAPVRIAFSTACRARPCRPGSTTACRNNDVGDLVNFIRSMNPEAERDVSMPER